MSVREVTSKLLPYVEQKRNKVTVLEETMKAIQDDQKLSGHLMITIQKVTSNVQSVTRQSPDIY
jgi:hypothetical protein